MTWPGMEVLIFNMGGVSRGSVRCTVPDSHRQRARDWFEWAEEWWSWFAKTKALAFYCPQGGGPG